MENEKGLVGTSTSKCITTGVQAIVRIRPLLDRERLLSAESCVDVVSEEQLLLDGERLFTFDRVLPPQTEQGLVYACCASNLVRRCMEGFNATVLAYGQTGSGKTFTLGSGPEVDTSVDTRGIIPRALEDLFTYINEVDPKLPAPSVSVSYIEIYKEELRDLLDSATPKKTIQLREKDDGSMVLIGCSEVVVTNVDEAVSWLQIGNAARITSSTRMNKRSSRSHAIFTAHLKQVKLVSALQPSSSSSSTGGTQSTSSQSRPLGNVSQRIVSKFHFVDLAGSERVARTGNVGERFKESVHINSGLLALGNVISALSGNKKKLLHIPYRQSKVTRLLKDSLGGNSNTIMLACVSPAASNYGETLNTLKYAQRVRRIKNVPIINREFQGREMDKMRTEIAVLKEELSRAHTIPPPSTADTITSAGGENIRQLKMKIRELEKQLTKNQLDLATDEEMFAEKVQELNSVQEQVRSLMIDKEDLEQQLIESRQREQKLLCNVEYLTSQLGHSQNEREEINRVRSQDDTDQQSVEILSKEPESVGKVSPECLKTGLDFSTRALIQALSEKNKKLISQTKPPSENKPEVVANKINEELQKVIEKKRILNKLEKELKEREVALAERETILAERDLLDAKRIRASQTTNKDCTRLKLRLKALDTSIREEEEMIGPSTMGREEGMCKPITHIQDLCQEREAILRQQNEIKAKMDSDSFLSQDEERRFVELSEWMEVIDATIEYRTKQIDSKKKVVLESLNQEHVGLKSKLVSLGDRDTRYLLGVYLQKFVDLKVHLEEGEYSRQELKVQLKERDELIDTLERCLQQTRAEIKRRLSLQQKEHAQEIKTLMKDKDETGQDAVSRSMLENRIKDLEKELYYYRRTSRDLKKQLKSYIQKSGSLHATPSVEGTGREFTSDSRDAVGSSKLQEGSQTSSQVEDEQSGGEECRNTPVAGSKETSHSASVKLVKKSKKELRQIGCEELKLKQEAARHKTNS